MGGEQVTSVNAWRMALTDAQDQVPAKPSAAQLLATTCSVLASPKVPLIGEGGEGHCGAVSVKGTVRTCTRAATTPARAWGSPWYRQLDSLVQSQHT